MASDKAFRGVRKTLESLGYEMGGTSNGGSFFRQEGFTPVSVNPGIADHAARHLITKVQKAHRTFQAPAKRNAAGVKERQAGDRERAAAEKQRHEVEIQRLVERREAMLSGVAGQVTGAEMRLIERHIEQEQKALRYWNSLMTSVPSANAHSGRPRAQHRA